MNRYLNKALIYKEWLAVRWVVLLMGLANLFLVIIPVFEQVTVHIEMGEGTQGNAYLTLGTVLFYTIFGRYLLMYGGLILLLSFLLFNMDRLSTTYSVTASMPFTRKQLILSKYFVGLSSIITLQVINLIFISTAFLLHKNSFLPNSYFSALHWVTFMLTFNIVLFSFAMLIQTLMGNALVAAPITAILIVAPIFIVTTVEEILQLHVGDVKIMTQMLIIIENMIDSLQPKHVDVNSIGFQYLGVIAAVFISVSIVFVVLSFYAYQKNSLERNGEIILFSMLERFFIFGVALCLGLLMSLLIGEGILNIYNTNVRVITVDVLLVTFFILGYWGTKKLLNIAKQN